MNNINILGHYISNMQQSINALSSTVTKLSNDVQKLEERLTGLESYNEALNKSIAEVAPLQEDGLSGVSGVSGLPGLPGLEEQDTSIFLNLTTPSTVQQDNDIEIVPKKKKPVKKQSL